MARPPPWSMAATCACRSPQAPVQMLFTGHMDTVYPIDHPFQAVTRIDDNRLGGPGVADMKGGLAVLLAALSAVEASPLAERFGYDVLINSDEETGSASSAALIARCASGKVAALTYEPALPDGTLAGARGGTGNFTIVCGAEAPMRAAIPRRDATPSSRRRGSRWNCRNSPPTTSPSTRRGSTVAGRTMSCPTWPCCTSTSDPARWPRSSGPALPCRPSPNGSPPSMM